MFSDSSTSNEILLNGMRNRESFEHWYGMGDTISRVANHTCGPTIGVKGKHGLDGNIKSLDLEGLEHELGHLFSVGFWVLRCFGKEALMLRWVDSKLVGEAVLPDLFHIVPIGNNT